MIAIHLEIYDEERAVREGGIGAVRCAFDGMTIEQGDAALLYLKSIERKLGEKVDEMKKYGTGEVIPEPGDPKPSEDTFGAEDREALAEENTQADSAE